MLKEFWAFLLGAREAQRLGALSLSLHLSHAVPTYPVNLAGDDIDGKANPKANGKTEPVRSGEKFVPSLLQCDHIKVYHDARYAMHVRTVLDVWNYAVEFGKKSDGEGEGKNARNERDGNMDAKKEGSSSRVNEKVRPLYGAKLVLLDESVQGILIC